MKKNIGSKPAVKTENAAGTRLFEMRITSDEIKLPGGRTGFYACTECGLALVVDRSRGGFANGGKLVIELLTELRKLKRDKKSGAREITVQ